MNDTRSKESWRTVSSSPGAAEQHLLVRHEPAQPHRVHRDAVHARAAGAVGVVGGRVGDGREAGILPGGTDEVGRAGGRARGGVDLVGVVQLDDLDRLVEAGRLAREGHHEHRADGEVGGDEHADAAGRRPAARAASRGGPPTSRSCRRRRARPASTQCATLAGEASGTENSTTTSAPARSPRSSPSSKRPTSSRSSASSTARHTVAPIRPLAPMTETLVVLMRPTLVRPAGAPRHAGSFTFRSSCVHRTVTLGPNRR